MFHFGDPIHPAVAGAFSATGNPLLFKVPNDFRTSWVPSSPGHHLRDDTRAQALTLRRLSFGRGQGLWLLQNCWDTCGNHLCMYVYIYIYTFLYLCILGGTPPVNPAAHDGPFMYG